MIVQFYLTTGIIYVILEVCILYILGDQETKIFVNEGLNEKEPLNIVANVISILSGIILWPVCIVGTFMRIITLIIQKFSNRS